MLLAHVTFLEHSRLNEEYQERTSLLINFLGEQVFDEAQKNVPTQSGDLKKAGKLIPAPDGFTIMYDTPYAYYVHEGQPQTDMKPHVSTIPRHIRKLTVTKKVSTGVAGISLSISKITLIPIKEHTKTYKPGFKPTKRSDGTWTTKAVTANKDWIQQAYKIKWHGFKEMFKNTFNLENILPREINIQNEPTQK